MGLGEKALLNSFLGDQLCFRSSIIWNILILKTYSQWVSETVFYHKLKYLTLSRLSPEVPLN